MNRAFSSPAKTPGRPGGRPRSGGRPLRSDAFLRWKCTVFAEFLELWWEYGCRAAGGGLPIGRPCHLWLEVALRDVTVDRRTGAVERHGRIEYRVNALEFAARVVHALTQRLAIEFVSLCSVARPGRHWFRQRAEAGGARARRAWPRRRQSAMETHRRARCPALTLLPVTIRTTSSPTTSRESASPSRNRSWRLGPPPQACARRQAARANGCTRG